MKARIILLAAIVCLLAVAVFLRVPQMSSPTAATDGAAPMLRGLISGDRTVADPANALVTTVVRTNLGELKWVAMQATDYTPMEAEGRRLFLQSGCTYCHSQYSRPTETDIRPWGTISTDPRRWGPMPEPGEYAIICNIPGHSVSR
jgi:hypothetical protein